MWNIWVLDSFHLLFFLLSVLMSDAAQTVISDSENKNYLTNGYVVKYYSSRECTNHDGLGLLAVKLLNADKYDEPQEGCDQTTVTPDGTYEGGIFGRPLTQSVEYRKDEGPPLQAGYIYMQYDNSTDVCGESIATPIWQQYWYLGMCAITEDLENYFTLRQVDFNGTSFDVEYTIFDHENEECDEDLLKVVDGTSYDLNCNESGKDHWVQLHNIEDTQAVTIDYGGALNFYSDQGCTGESLRTEVLNTQYIEDILFKYYGIDEIIYDKCVQQSNVSDIEYYEAKCNDNLGRGFMELNLDTVDSFACAGDTPISGVYFQEDGCFLTDDYNLAYNSTSFTDMVFNEDNISYSLHYFSDDNCKTELTSSDTIYVDLNIQCGKNSFYVAYPIGFKIDCTKVAGSDDDGDYEIEKHLDSFEIWFIFIVLIVVVLLSVGFGAMWWRRRIQSHKYSENDLINEALLENYGDIK